MRGNATTRPISVERLHSVAGGRERSYGGNSLAASLLPRCFPILMVYPGRTLDRQGELAARVEAYLPDARVEITYGCSVEVDRLRVGRPGGTGIQEGTVGDLDQAVLGSSAALPPVTGQTGNHAFEHGVAVGTVSAGTDLPIGVPDSKRRRLSSFYANYNSCTILREFHPPAWCIPNSVASTPPAEPYVGHGRAGLPSGFTKCRRSVR